MHRRWFDEKTGRENLQLCVPQHSKGDLLQSKKSFSLSRKGKIRFGLSKVEGDRLLGKEDTFYREKVWPEEKITKFHKKAQPNTPRAIHSVKKNIQCDDNSGLQMISSFYFRQRLHLLLALLWSDLYERMRHEIK